MPVPASNYNGLIPQATDQISVSQGQLLNNFGAIQTLIDVDHVDFANANAGQHNQVTMPVQGAAPAFNPGTVGLFNLLNATSGRNELYVENSVGAITPMTASLQATVGYTYLPSGILLKWYFGNTGAVVGGVVNIPTNIGGTPNFNSIFYINVAPLTPS